MTDAAEGRGAFTILIVEDDSAVKSLIATALKVQGYRLLEASTGGAALLEVTTKNPDVIILDLGLPDADGIDLIRQVRTWSHTPIIVVSARTEDADKVAALDAGADDYLIKPFSVEELLARLRVATRRLAADAGADRDGPIYENGDLRIDYAARTVTLAGEEVHLTPHRVQAAGAFGPQHRQGAHSQRHPEGGVGQRPGQRPAVAARVHGHPAQEDRARPGPPRLPPNPCGHRLPHAAEVAPFHRRRARGSLSTVSLGAHPRPVRPCPAAGRTPRGARGARTRSPAPCRTPSCAGTPAASAFPRPP